MLLPELILREFRELPPLDPVNRIEDSEASSCKAFTPILTDGGIPTTCPDAAGLLLGVPAKIEGRGTPAWLELGSSSTVVDLGKLIMLVGLGAALMLVAVGVLVICEDELTAVDVLVISGVEEEVVELSTVVVLAI